MVQCPAQERKSQTRAWRQPPQATGAVVAHRPDDNRGRLVARADSRCPAQGGHTHCQADHLQPCARRRHRQTCRALAPRAQIRQENQGLASDKSDQHCQPHKHPLASGGGRRQAVRRLGDGHNCRLLRARNRHAYGALNQLHPHGETQGRQKGHAYGKDGGTAAVPIP